MKAWFKWFSPIHFELSDFFRSSNTNFQRGGLGALPLLAHLPASSRLTSSWVEGAGGKTSKKCRHHTQLGGWRPLKTWANEAEFLIHFSLNSMVNTHKAVWKCWCFFLLKDWHNQFPLIFFEGLAICHHLPLVIYMTSHPPFRFQPNVSTGDLGRLNLLVEFHLQWEKRFEIMGCSTLESKPTWHMCVKLSNKKKHNTMETSKTCESNNTNHPNAVQKSKTSK